MSSLLMQAAQSAAAADGLAPPTAAEQANALQQARAATANKTSNERRMAGGVAPPVAKKSSPPLRRGKWTQEEEAYAVRLIQEFKAGLLPLTDGTTLRTFLSKLLNCDPMRISKKFVGNNCIGKQVFRRRTADLNRLTPEQIQQSRAELSECVFKTFLQSILYHVSPLNTLFTLSTQTTVFPFPLTDWNDDSSNESHRQIASNHRGLPVRSRRLHRRKGHPPWASQRKKSTITSFQIRRGCSLPVDTHQEQELPLRLPTRQIVVPLRRVVLF